MAVAGEIESAISEPIIEEVTRILKDKFKWQPERVADAEGTIRELGKLVTPSEQLNVVPSDPDDDQIAECSAESRSEAIISGDKHLLRLVNVKGIRVMRVAEFLAHSRER